MTASIHHLAPAVPAPEPPHNDEAEMGVLGALLVRNAAYEAVQPILRPGDFYLPLHGRIYEAIARTIDAGSVADPVTLKRQFEGDPALEEHGGARYLAKLAGSVVTIINAEHYARVIAALARRRRLIEIGYEIIEEAGQAAPDDAPPDRVIESAESALFDLAERGAGRGLVSAAAIAREHTAEVERAYKAGGKIIGVGTGLHDLDRIAGGLKPGRLIVLAGRPSMGKSLVAGVLAMNAARDGRHVAIFSPEQTRDQWMARWIARRTGLSSERQARGDLVDNDWHRFIAAADEIGGLAIAIDDTSPVGVAHIRQRCRRLKRSGQLDLVIVDHLQKMRQEGRAENRRIEIGDITNGLAALAKEIGVPVVLVSQLSRAVEQREDKRPSLGDLRESGDIEQDADLVIFVYRRSYYLDRDKVARRLGESEDAFTKREVEHSRQSAEWKNRAELIIDKNRSGRIGTVEVFFDGETATLLDEHKGTELR